MPKVEQIHQARAVELVSKLGCWGRDMTGQPETLGHIDLDLMARALADAEARGAESRPTQAQPASLGESTCAGSYQGTIRDLIHRLEVCVADEQERPLPQNHVIAVFCDVIRYMRDEAARPFQAIQAQPAVAGDDAECWAVVEGHDGSATFFHNETRAQELLTFASEGSRVVRYIPAPSVASDPTLDVPVAEDAPRCNVASANTLGHYECTRELGHEGPCAAVPQYTPRENDATVQAQEFLDRSEGRHLAFVSVATESKGTPPTPEEAK